LPYHTSFIYPGPINTISLLAGFNDIRDVTKFKESIRRNKSVTDVKVEVWTDIKNMPERIEVATQSSAKEKTPVFAADNQKTNYVPDEIDCKIIDKLIDDSMQPFGNIAKEIGTSINTVSRKYKRLTENGIIRPVIQISLTKLGYNALIIFSITFASESDPNDVMKAILEINNSYLLIKTSGEVDLLAYFVLRDLSQLLKTQKTLSLMEGISKIDMKMFPELLPWPNRGEYISTF
jgi:DNA-binding Lrp family transcriptional regulator